ncbi:MAG TPA: glycosyltransferase family 1 protein [Thermomicrobiales bacterium]|nr:glycosyltransferase family 1 protein [Thermomicrobiales bacterium]
MTSPEFPLIAIDGNFLQMPGTGIATYLRCLHDALVANADAYGIRVSLLEPGAGRLLKPGGRAQRLLWDAFGVTGKALATSPRPDLLHLPQFSAPFSSPMPMVVTIHDVIPLVLPEYRASGAMRIYLRIMTRTVKKARRIVVPSESAAADVIRVLRIPAAKVVVIPEAASPDLVPDQTGESREFVRQRFGIEGPYLFNIGGFDVRKNLPLLLQAFAQAWPLFPAETTLAIAGAPQSDRAAMFPPLDPLIAKLGLGNHVRLVGRVSDDERRSLYQAAAAYVTPSMYEGFGLTPLEAMACGVPAIVANRTSLPEVVGNTGIVVEPTVDAFAQAMVDLLRDDARRANLGETSLARASEFTWEKAAAETVAVYRAVTTRSSGAGTTPAAG